MGRRFLKKIDPSLDLTQHLFLPEQLPRPWDRSRLFGRDAKLIVEVGSGKGLFLETGSRALPECDFLGIEIAGRYARYSAARLAKHRIPNAKIVHGNAEPLFAELLPESSVAEVHVYFPDPWWKTRHRRRRVMNEAFTRNVQRVLMDYGRLHFWTDVEEYFEATLAVIEDATQLGGPQPVAQRAAQSDLDYRTHFERRTRLHGLPVHRAEFCKLPRHSCYRRSGGHT